MVTILSHPQCRNMLYLYRAEADDIGEKWLQLKLLVPDNKDFKINIDSTSIRHFNVGSMSNRCRSEDLWYLGWYGQPLYCSQVSVTHLEIGHLQMKSMGAWCSKELQWLNSLGPSDAIWRHRSGSTLAQVMACWLTAPSHYLNQCWLIISKVHWHSYEGNLTLAAQAINH